MSYLKDLGLDTVIKSHADKGKNNGLFGYATFFVKVKKVLYLRVYLLKAFVKIPFQKFFITSDEFFKK